MFKKNLHLFGRVPPWLVSFVLMCWARALGLTPAKSKEASEKTGLGTPRGWWQLGQHDSRKSSVCVLLFSADPASLSTYDMLRAAFEVMGHACMLEEGASALAAYTRLQKIDNKTQ